MFSLRTIAAFLSALALSSALPALAQDAPKDSPPAQLRSTSGATTAVASADQKRPMPSYDGREPESKVGQDLALAVPRIVFFPLWLVSEYVLRRPLEWLVINAEKNQWPTLLLDFFTFEDRTIGVFPTALFDFRLRPSVGLYAFWDKAIFERNSLRFYIAYGGPDWGQLRVTDRIKINDDARLAFTFGVLNRPDFPFFGRLSTVGMNDALFAEDIIARYEYGKIEGLAAFESILGDAGSLRAFAGVRRVSYGSGTALGDPSINDLVAQGRIETPEGYGFPYTVYQHGLELAWDTRKKRPASGSGVRLEVESSQMFDLDRSLKSPILGYGGALGGFLDIRHNRTVSLFVSANFLEPLEKDGVIPFPELISASGSGGTLNGFIERALIGQSTVAARFEYRWPVWVFLDGTLHFAVGNAFGKRAEDFDFERLRMSFGLGMRTSGKPDQAFHMAVALGTDTFEQGAEITSLRFVLGEVRGF